MLCVVELCDEQSVAVLAYEPRCFRRCVFYEFGNGDDVEVVASAFGASAWVLELVSDEEHPFSELIDICDGWCGCASLDFVCECESVLDHGVFRLGL